MASKLQAICRTPECMAEVGRQAGERLYLSWADAVKRAEDRYGIVMENYRMGRYDEHHKPMDGFLNAQGTMMETLGPAPQPGRWSGGALPGGLGGA